MRVPNRASVMKTARRDTGRQVEANPSSRTRAVNNALLERTVQLFEARSGQSLSKEDARQIVENVSGFSACLRNGGSSIERKQARVSPRTSYSITAPYRSQLT